MVETTDQSRVLEMEISLSSPAASSLLREGKLRAVMLAEWCNNDPSSRFLGFSRILFPANVGTEGYSSVTAGGAAAREYN
jgi:hypothetical protein